MANKVKFGLKSVHYAVITVGEDGAFAYGTPVAIPGAVNLSLSPLGDKTEFYADDDLYFNTTPNNGYEGSLEVALVPDSFKKDVLGYTEDVNKVLFENSEALPKDFALLFEFKGDKNSVRHVLYKVSAARANIESGTKTSSVEVKTETFDITASPDPNKHVKAKAEPTATGYDAWYTSVYEYTEV